MSIDKCLIFALKSADELKKKTNERQLFDIDFFVKYLKTNRVAYCPLVSSEPIVASIVGVKTIPHCMCMCMLEKVGNSYWIWGPTDAFSCLYESFL